MARFPVSPNDVKRRVGRVLLLLYVGYIGLAVYLYCLIQGSILAYASASVFLGLVMVGCFKFYFRGVRS